MSNKRTAKPREKKPRPDPNGPFRLGFDAGRAGRPDSENPYHGPSPEEGYWHDGWCEGRRLYEAVERIKEAS